MLKKIILEILTSFSNFIGKKPLPATQKARIKLSAIISGITGKIGGSVFQNGKGSGLIRNNKYYKTQASKQTFTSRSMELTWSGCMAQSLNITGQVMPDGSYIPSTNTVNAQQNIRIVSKSWRQLLQSDREAWISLAKTLDGKKVFGNKTTRSGYDVYLQTNIALINVGFSPVARPECHWEAIAIVIGEEILFGNCWVCGGTATYCTFGRDDDGEDVGTVTERATFGSTAASLLFYASAPMSPGRTTQANTKIVAVIKKVDIYEDFLLRPLLNKFYGKNLSGSNITFNSSWVSAGGSVLPALPEITQMPVGDPTFVATELAQRFTWYASNNTYDFGTIPVGSVSKKTFLVFGFNQLVSSAYTIVTTGGGFGAPFAFVYGDPDNPLELDTNKTDQYGNVLPIPLLVKFTPTGESPVTATATFTVTSSGETITLTFTGQGS